MEAKRIKNDVFRSVPKAILNPGDVVLTIDGALLGLAAVYTANDPPCCISNHMVRICHGNAVLPEFLCEFINCGAGQQQIKREITGSAIPGIRIDAIERILIPVPPRDQQLEFISMIKEARDNCQKKQAIADSLTSSIDEFLLNELELKLTIENDRNIFAVQLKNLRSRYDVDFNLPRFQKLREQIDSSHFRVISVGDICRKMLAGFAAGKDAQAGCSQNGIPHIRPQNIKKSGDLTLNEAKFVPPNAINRTNILSKGEVLFNNTNSTALVGKSAVFELDLPCVCSNHVTRLILRKELAESHYVASLFNVYQSIGYFGILSTNFNNQAGINQETLSFVRIPLPDLQTQYKIVQEIKLRRDSANRIRAKALHEWNVAKNEFEKHLLRGAGNA